MAVVCRGPPAKGSPPTAFLRAQTNDHCAFQCPAELAFGVLLRQPRNQHADAVHLLALLRARPERPRRRCTAERDQQFPPSDGDCHTPLPCEARKCDDTTSRSVLSLGTRRGRGARRASCNGAPPGSRLWLDFKRLFSAAPLHFLSDLRDDVWARGFL